MAVGGAGGGKGVLLCPPTSWDGVSEAFLGCATTSFLPWSGLLTGFSLGARVPCAFCSAPVRSEHHTWELHGMGRCAGGC